MLAQDGGCPPGIPTIPELSLAEVTFEFVSFSFGDNSHILQYLGQWYTQYHIPLARLEGATCIGAEYGEHGGGDGGRWENKFIISHIIVEQSFGFPSLFVQPPSTEDPGKVSVHNVATLPNGTVDQVRGGA